MINLTLILEKIKSREGLPSRVTVGVDTFKQTEHVRGLDVVDEVIFPNLEVLSK